MGYYENPPIINMYGDPNKASEGIASLGRSIGDAFTNIAKMKELQAKEAEKSLSKLREDRNKTLLGYNDRLDNWSDRQKIGNPFIDETKALVKSEILDGADATIALDTVTNAEERSKLEKIKGGASETMKIMGKLGEIAAGETATWLTLKPLQLNTAGGWGVNANDKELEPKTEALNILANMNTQYETSGKRIYKEDGRVMVNIFGKRKDGYVLDYKMDAVNYINAYESGAGGFLQKIDDVKDYTTAALKGIYDPKIQKINPEFLEPKDSQGERLMGADRKRSIYGQKVNEEKTMDKIRQQASITAQGYLTAGGSANLRALLNSTLKQGTKFYDGVFKEKPNEEQLDILTNALAENTYNTLTSGLEYSYENGQKVFWSGPKLQAFTEKIEKPKAPKLTNDDNTVDPRIFSKNKMGEYYNKVKDMYKSKDEDDHFSITIPGPKGGAGETYEFYYDPKKKGVVSSKDNTKAISLKAFAKWMKENNVRSKRPSL